MGRCVLQKSPMTLAGKVGRRANGGNFPINFLAERFQILLPCYCRRSK